DAAGVKLAAQFGRDRRGDQLARGGQVVEAFEEVIQPGWNGRAAALREAARRRDVGDGEYARDDLHLDAGRGGFVTEAEEAVGREEKLCDGPRGPGRTFAFQI